ncbi:MAG: hypothetical protein K0R90_19 [Oscillospiraceae bacterium]|jgi:predicted DNA-binding protein YlxM (UPF0122 family)|nr:hypothetical protein [Oscillospiraceae bacterium]
MNTKNLEVSVLLDFYGEMLTEKQRDLVELYYNEDLSLAEIAELEKITRQGVRDSIKRGEAFLFELEQKLGMVKRFQNLSQTLEQINELAMNSYHINDQYKYSKEIEINLKKINELVQDILDENL